VLTCDALFGGKLIFYQHQAGYRFSLDAVLLAGLAGVGREERVFDLGTGCGVVPIILAYRGLARRLTGLELQPELVEVAQMNVVVNGLGKSVQILELDFREVTEHFEPGVADVVVSNPPYRRLDSGRINPNRQRAVARHELTGSVQDVFLAGKYLLRDGGRLVLIYPAARMAHLFETARDCGFSAKRLMLIYSTQTSAARLLVLECRKAGGEELLVEQPLTIYQADGSYTEAVQSLYAE
jgi:tRNA1Val (adenine37-N6)-methyltransferase